MSQLAFNQMSFYNQAFHIAAFVVVPITTGYQGDFRGAGGVGYVNIRSINGLKSIDHILVFISIIVHKEYIAR